jgi:hypothetical protein
MQSPLNILTVEEYLEAEKSSDIRHEYVAGQVFAFICFYMNEGQS